MIQKKLIFPAHGHNLPAVMCRNDMHRIIHQLHVQARFPGITFEGGALFAVFLRDGGAAVAQPIAVCTRFFHTFECPAVFLGNALDDFAMRQVHDLARGPGTV